MSLLHRGNGKTVTAVTRVTGKDHSVFGTGKFMPNLFTTAYASQL